MPRTKKTLAELLAMPCRKPGQIRNNSGKCYTPSSRTTSDIWELISGRWRKKNKTVKQSVSSRMGCGPNQIYSAKAQRCVDRKAPRYGPRKPRTTCKYGFNESTGKCNKRPSNSQKANNPAYKREVVIDKNGKSRVVYKLVNRMKPMTEGELLARQYPEQYVYNLKTKRYNLLPEYRKPRPAPKYPCPPGQRYSAKKKECVSYTKSGLGRCPKGKRRDPKTKDCISVVPSFLKRMDLF